jgi:hypothetical protein
MNGNILYGLLSRLGVRLIAAAAFYVIGVRSGLHTITGPDAEGIGILILLIGSVYAVMFAFVIYVIWGQFTEVETFMMRECKSLKELLRFSDLLNPDSGRTVRRSVEDYVHRVVKSEWTALAERQRDRYSEQAFTELLEAVLQCPHASPQDEAVYQRLIDIVREAGGHRDERLTKSLTQIPATLIQLVHIMETGLLLLVLLYPFHHWTAGMCCFLLVAVILFLANLVMTDTDNPFKGVYNVSPRAFSDLRI